MLAGRRANLVAVGHLAAGVPAQEEMAVVVGVKDAKSGNG
jgi:hypothetical protein